MNRTETMKAKVARYLELRGLFSKFCAEARAAMPPGNAFGLTMGIAGENACPLTILGHEGRVRFGVRDEPPPMLAKLTFERSLAKGEFRPLVTLYFDKLDNATEDPDEDVWVASLRGSDLQDYLAVRLLEEFFRDVDREAAR